MLHVKEKHTRKVECGLPWWNKTAVVKIQYGVSCKSPLLDYDFLEGRNHALFIFVYPGLSLVPGTWYIIINSLFFQQTAIEELESPRGRARHYE